jgi:hypothetical protein
MTGLTAVSKAPFSRNLSMRGCTPLHEKKIIVPAN